MRLQKNRNPDKDRPMPQSAPSARYEEDITAKTRKILYDFRCQLGDTRTAMQVRVDAMLRLVVPKFAFADLGVNQLPAPLTEKAPVNSWWVCLELEAVALMHGYYEAIREGRSLAFENARARWAVLLSAGINQYYSTYIPIRHKVGYILMTKAEQIEMLDERTKAALKKEEARGAQIPPKD